MKSSFNVYKTVTTGTTLRLKNIYSLELLKEFRSRTDAVKWIEENGKPKTDYLVIEAFQVSS
jgi:hypothetical protein